ncbi:MAG TPA: AAA family ATPase [Thermoanaerobaculia bacterium]|nr:AAA family ATPase [Thermoanaerobaculia bacterium]
MNVHLLVAAAPFADARAHLDAELALLDLRLRRQVMRLRAARLLTEDQFRGLYIPDDQADAILQRAENEDVTAAALTRHIDELRGAIDRRAALTVRGGKTLPLVALRERFGLTAFEIEILIIAVAPEIDLRYHTLYAYAQNDMTRRYPTVDFALQLLFASREDRHEHRAAFRPDAPLMQHRLVRLGEDAQEKEQSLLARPLRTDERVTDQILGGDALDPMLVAAARSVTPRKRLDDLVLAAAVREQVLNVIPLLARGGAALVLEGARGTGRKSIAEAICGAMNAGMIVVDGARAATLPDAAALLRREALLSGRALVIDDFEKLPAGSRFDGAIRFLITTEPVSADGYRIDVPMPGAAMRARLWRDAGAAPADDALAAKFVLSGGQIRVAVEHARAAAALRGAPGIELRDLIAGAHAQSSASLRALAQKVGLHFGWSDIVLPAKPLQQLREICISVQYRRVVFDDWGFEGRVAGGKGVAVLFNGASGTGKTMAASIIARELGLQMYRVDLSTVVSKYIGETEKNLSRIFAEAQASSAVLFFDEADALFGKRSEVKDAHDRYANIEVAYLLQRVESYEGIVILATNLGRNIDEAFARRMQHTIEFPFPEAAQREQIWRGMLPQGAPIGDDTDFAFLAKQFELSGGNIRNVVVAAAFQAAADGGVIGMRQMIAATARELDKIGRLPSRSEFRDYYDWIREP